MPLINRWILVKLTANLPKLKKEPIIKIIVSTYQFTEHYSKTSQQLFSDVLCTHNNSSYIGILFYQKHVSMTS